MNLGTLITKLEEADQTLRVPKGFAEPHSWRGSYDELAFEPISGVYVSDMLKSAKEAIGTTYTGWKGGEFVMSLETECYIAEEGTCGEPLTEILMYYMLTE